MSSVVGQFGGSGGGGSPDSVIFRCGRNWPTASNMWLHTIDGIALPVAPFRVPYTAQLSQIVVTGGAVQTWDVEVYLDGIVRAGATPLVGSAIAVLNVAGQNSVHQSYAGITIPAGSELGVYMRGTNIQYPHVEIYLERIG